MTQNLCSCNKNLSSKIEYRNLNYSVLKNEIMAMGALELDAHSGGLAVFFFPTAWQLAKSPKR